MLVLRYAKTIQLAAPTRRSAHQYCAGIGLHLVLNGHFLHRLSIAVSVDPDTLPAIHHLPRGPSDRPEHPILSTWTSGAGFDSSLSTITNTCEPETG